jgi:alpha-tubulin suppressor-like RCC1 family protein
MSRVVFRQSLFHLRPHWSRPVQNLQWARHGSSYEPPRRRGRGIIIGLVAITAAAGGAVYAFPTSPSKEPQGPPKAEIVFEAPRKQALSKEDNRALVSSQHLQVKKSLEDPGLYAWGSNSGKVVAPDSNETVIKTPRRIPYFDGQILRDVKLDRNFGAALNENGDLVQWGLGFSEDNAAPTVTLSGESLVKLAISKDRVIALSSSGSVFSIPVSSGDQATGPKVSSSSWIPFWSNKSKISYRELKPQNLGWGERVTDISSGLEHCLLLTSSGRVFSSASSAESFPSRGQLGVPGLTWASRPKGAFDQPHELGTLRGFKISQIATGDYHSLVLDNAGRVFAFGDNSTGQLGFEPTAEVSFVDTPSILALNRLYNGTSMLPKVTAIAAGGSNTFFMIDAAKNASQTPSTALESANSPGRVVADVWACGEGIHGSLGTGKWTHISSTPTKIKALSNLSEFDEKANKAVPIRLAHLSVGSTHAAAIMDNLTYLGASNKTSGHDTNWGADIMWWGGNEEYQLGTGKRNNVCAPIYIKPLDGGLGDADHGRKGEFHRFQITPRMTTRIGESGKGRKVSIEQRVECGRFVTAVYSGA